MGFFWWDFHGKNPEKNPWGTLKGQPLVMTSSLPWYRWFIEIDGNDLFIDGLPGFTELKNGGSFHGKSPRSVAGGMFNLG